MERNELPFPDTLTPAEEIAVEQVDIMVQMVSMIKKLICELAQYRIMDEEEKQVQALVDKMGGNLTCGE